MSDLKVIEPTNWFNYVQIIDTDAVIIKSSIVQERGPGSRRKVRYCKFTGFILDLEPEIVIYQNL